MPYYVNMKEYEENKQLIGRVYEQQLVKDYFDSPKSEHVAVYGRRSVGKTYLIKRCFDEKFDFWFTGMYETSKSVHLRQFARELSKYSSKKCEVPKDWFEAFEMLNNYLLSLGKEKVVVFLDELPWMDNKKSNFLQAFSYFWNMWSSEKTVLKLYVCGSATTWMLDKFVGDKGGLYGRTSRTIYLSPFTLGETELFLEKMKGFELTRKQILELYMIFGGVPYYLDMLSKDLPVSKNIDNLFFSEGAPLRTEYDFLFRSLFNESGSYKKVIEALSSKMKGLSKSEIVEATKIKQGGTLTEILNNLCSCDFIRKYTAIGKPEKDCIYQLTDLFSLFHLRFVAKNSGQDASFWSNMDSSPAKNTWSGYAFEQVCLHHIKQIKSKLSILGVLSNTYSWFSKPFVDKDGSEWNGGQIDMLIDRKDDVINICEMKFVSSEFEITEKYDEHLRERDALFKKVTKTRKALHHTFVTTYGVKKNKYSGIVQNEVTMDDLFENA